MKSIDSHKKTDYVTIRKYDKIESDGNQTSKNINLNVLKEKIIRENNSVSSINRGNMTGISIFPSFEENKVDVQQRIISVIVFALIVTGIALTVLATVSAKEMPNVQGVVMY
jgi:hypothetical protein